MKNNILVQKYRKSARMLLFVIQFLFVFGQGVTIAQEIESISLRNLRQHMDSIASDVTEGRFTGSPGYRKAAQYAANVFRKAGLEPGYTDENGEKSYFQPVPFVRKNYTSTSLTIRKNGKDKIFYHSDGYFVVFNAGIQNKRIRMASPAFIGYGISEPEKGWDDYAGLDVKGKWVIVIDGVPPADANPAFPDCLRKQYADWKTRDSLRYEALMKHKVAGLIILPYKKEIDNWEGALLHSYRDYYCYLDDEMNGKETSDPVLPVILIGPELLKIFFDGQSFDPVNNKGDFHSYVLNNIKISVTVNCKKEQVNCHNVIAIVRGTDSTLRNEYLTVGAHLDHLGKFRDHVYNGANDNASGCVIILEAAKAIALNPPKRPVLFILYTAEELGMVGSKHFVKYPPISSENILLNINIEQIGSKNRDEAGIGGIGLLQFKESFYKAGKSIVDKNLKYDLIENCINDLKNSVDLWSFYKKGIPTVMISSGGFMEHHTPQDKITLIDFEHLLKAAKLLHSFIMELGNEQHSSVAPPSMNFSTLCNVNTKVHGCTPLHCAARYSPPSKKVKITLLWPHTKALVPTEGGYEFFVGI